MGSYRIAAIPGDGIGNEVIPAGIEVVTQLARSGDFRVSFEHLGHHQAAADIVRAVEQVIMDGPHTPDMKGKASTMEVGAAVAEAVRAQSKVAA